MPRLVNDDVFKNALNAGLRSQDYFAFASGKQDDKYLGFVFGENASIIFDESSLLIARDVALAYENSLKPVVIDPPPQVEPDHEGNQPPMNAPQPVIKEPIPVTPAIAKNHFYGTINLDPVRAKMDFATIVDEVIEQFTAKFGVDVKISVDIQATANKDGFDEAMQRAVKENCRVLRFGNAEFEQ